MPYGGVITKSWSIFFRHRMLWLLAAIFSVLSSILSIPFNILSFAVPSDAGKDIGLTEIFGSLRWLTDNLPLILLIAGALVLLSFVMWVVSYLFYAAILTAVDSLDRGEDVTFSGSLSAGGSNYLRFIGLVFLLVGTVAALAMVFFSPFAGAILNIIGGLPDSLLGLTRSGQRLANNLLEPDSVIALAGLFFIGLFLFTIFASLLYLLFELATRAIVLDGAKIFAGIGKALQILARAPGRVLATWLIIIGLSLGAGVALSIFIALLGAPLTLMQAMLVESRGLATAVAFIAIPAFIVSLIAILLSGLVAGYTATYWTVAYRRLTLLTHPPVSAPISPSA